MVKAERECEAEGSDLLSLSGSETVRREVHKKIEHFLRAGGKWERSRKWPGKQTSLGKRAHPDRIIFIDCILTGSCSAPGSLFICRPRLFVVICMFGLSSASASWPRHTWATLSGLWRQHGGEGPERQVCPR